MAGKRFSLGLDLVPRSCFMSNLRSELPASEWDRLRRRQYALAHNRCEICGSQGPRHPVECHERWDFTSKPGTQVLVGLIALCPMCHEVKHMGLAEHRGNLDRAIFQFCRVNNVERELALEIIRANFDEWAERSRQHWDLDISWLDQHGVDSTTITRVMENRRAGNQDQTKAKEILALMTKAFGPCPEGKVRIAYTHACGHAGASQLDDPDCVPEGELNWVEAMIADLLGSPCPDCLPAEPAEPKAPECAVDAVESTDGLLYDLL